MVSLGVNLPLSLLLVCSLRMDILFYFSSTIGYLVALLRYLMEDPLS